MDKNTSKTRNEKYFPECSRSSVVVVMSRRKATLYLSPHGIKHADLIRRMTTFEDVPAGDALTYEYKHSGFCPNKSKQFIDWWVREHCGLTIEFVEPNDNTLLLMHIDGYQFDGENLAAEWSFINEHSFQDYEQESIGKFMDQAFEKFREDIMDRLTPADTPVNDLTFLAKDRMTGEDNE